MTRSTRKPTAGPEQAALTHWANAYPLTAMRTLREAGYDREARAAFLTEVVGLGPEDVPDFAADSYLDAVGGGGTPLQGSARFSHGSLVRGAADECLRTVFGDAYGATTLDQSSLLIDDLIDLANDEGIDSLYDAARLLQRRLVGSSLGAYAATLEARRQPVHGEG
jgi:hypothetical protein